MSVSSLGSVWKTHTSEQQLAYEHVCCCDFVGRKMGESQCRVTWERRADGGSVGSSNPGVIKSSF